MEGSYGQPYDSVQSRIETGGATRPRMTGVFDRFVGEGACQGKQYKDVSSECAEATKADVLCWAGLLNLSCTRAIRKPVCLALRHTTADSGSTVQARTEEEHAATTAATAAAAAKGSLHDRRSGRTHMMIYSDKSKFIK